ncbi:MULTISPECIES: hypothetical protein [Nocardia]|uniref:hypothetical protein n=1 Tax=Nocardia TaxID=1817 RepID=UPI001893B495|nr:MULTISPECIES: hypothetical protein [Nocardia]MBF6348493.1 hypothetical protein [Nocardia flavorosea]
MPARNPVDLGDLAWLSEFDSDDQAEALTEIRNAAASTLASGDSGPLREVLHAWETTAAVMRDPVRRAVHAGAVEEPDFLEVDAPQLSDDA